MASFYAWALSFIMVLQAVAAYQFTVGGGNGWVPPFGAQESYNQWAGRNRFQVGDQLVFKYNPNEDSVLQVNSQDFDACKTTSPVASFKDGNTAFTFPKNGPFYFISGNATNCQKGEKLVIVVMAPRNPARSGSPSPAPAALASSTATPSPAAVAPSVATPLRAPSPSFSAATPLRAPSPSFSAATPAPVPSPSRSAATPAPVPSPSHSAATPSPTPSTAAPSPSPSAASPSPAPSVAPPAVAPSPALSPPSIAPSPAAPIVASPQPSQASGGGPSLPPSTSATEDTSVAASSSSVSAAATAVALLMSGLAMATF